MKRNLSNTSLTEDESPSFKKSNANVDIDTPTSLSPILFPNIQIGLSSKPFPGIHNSIFRSKIDSSFCGILPIRGKYFRSKNTYQSCTLEKNPSICILPEEKEKDVNLKLCMTFTGDDYMYYREKYAPTINIKNFNGIELTTQKVKWMFKHYTSQSYYEPNTKTILKLTSINSCYLIYCKTDLNEEYNWYLLNYNVNNVDTWKNVLNKLGLEFLNTNNYNVNNLVEHQKNLESEF